MALVHLVLLQTGGYNVLLCSVTNFYRLQLVHSRPTLQNFLKIIFFQTYNCLKWKGGCPFFLNFGKENDPNLIIEMPNDNSTRWVFYFNWHNWKLARSLTHKQRNDIKCSSEGVSSSSCQIGNQGSLNCSTRVCVESKYFSSGLYDWNHRKGREEEKKICLEVYLLKYVCKLVHILSQ